MAETAEVRLKRLQMRSMRRGIKEMDIILGGFSRGGLRMLDLDMLDLYEELLEENDHDLYQWVSGQVKTPEPYGALIGQIAEHQKQALLHGASAAHNLPLPIDIAQAPASNSGRPSSVILFRMCTPILTSVF